MAFRVAQGTRVKRPCGYGNDRLRTSIEIDRRSITSCEIDDRLSTSCRFTLRRTDNLN